jgi:anti-anti-sigma factor
VQQSAGRSAAGARNGASVTTYAVPTGLIVAARRSDGECVIQLVGELDIASWPQLAALVDEQRDDDRRVVFDLSGLTFLSTAGVSALLEVAQQWPDFRLRNPNRVILPILRTAGLDSSVELTDNEPIPRC